MRPEPWGLAGRAEGLGLGALQIRNQSRLPWGETRLNHYTRLGIENYGFSPLLLPDGFDFTTVHAADERVPAEAIEFGTLAVHRLLERYGG